MVDQVQRVLRELDRVVERGVAAVTLEVTAELVEATPVDLGWARANWVPSIGLPSGPESSDPSTAGVSAKVVEQQGALARVRGYTLNQGDVFVTNGVPYIKQLNDGSSQQAPAGFVDAAMQRGVSQALRRLR